MSSPPRVDFPTSDIDDIEMDGPPQEGTIEQSLSIAPPPQRLFLQGTPSAAGTPVRQRYANSVASTPMSGVAARRALGLSTPRRAPQTPLFVRKSLPHNQFISIHISTQPEALHSRSPVPHLLKHQRGGLRLTLILPLRTLNLLPFLREPPLNDISVNLADHILGVQPTLLLHQSRTVAGTFTLPFP